MSKSGQVGIEYLMIVGFVTFIVIGILGLAFFYTGTIRDRMRATQIDDFANKVISTAESVYYAGAPSKATISAYLPKSVQDIEVIGDDLVITLQTSSGINKRSFSSNVPIIEDSSYPLQDSDGIKKIIIIASSSDAIISQG